MCYTNTFREVKKYHGSSFRGIARNLALDVLSVRNTLLDVEKWYRRPRVHFLFIHHIFEDEVGNFEKVLLQLSKHHTFISYSEAVERVVSGNVDKPYISWSSDDGFKNNLKAAEVLDRFGAKACFFINPSSIGVSDTNWIANFCEQKLKMPPIEMMDWEDVADLQKRGHEIGAHTMKHDRISKMNAAEIKEDLMACKEVLKRQCGYVDHFAYPYGRFFDFNKMAFDLVFDTGYQSCATGERGCHISDGSKLNKEDLLIRRDQVICAWKLEHIMYFVAQSSKRASLSSNFLPESYSV